MSEPETLVTRAFERMVDVFAGEVTKTRRIFSGAWAVLAVGVIV